MTAPLFIMALFLAAIEARADIYRYQNAEGVECFTDAPTAVNAVKIVKEKTGPRRSGTKRVSKPATPPAATFVKPDNERNASYGCDIETHHDLPVRGPVTSPVGLRHDPIDGMIRDHKGVDIAVPEGTPVRPVASGVVVFSGCRQGYGNTVMIRHDDGMITLYAHHSINLKSAGDPVDRGSTIAFSGSTGRTTGPHLHFEAWKDGVNMTASFVPGAAAVSRHRDDGGIRRIVQADGTLMFTNLP